MAPPHTFIVAVAGAEMHKHGAGRASFEASRATGRASLDAGAGLDVDGGDDMGKKRRASFKLPAAGKGPAATRGQRNDDASATASSMNEF
jgi:hypothetical protein